MRRIPFATLLTGALLIAALLVYAFTTRVRFSEIAVRVRLGKADPSSVIREPGLYWTWPPPVERVVKFDNRLQVLDTSEGEASTRDGQNLIVGLFALWKIKDPLQFYRGLVTEERARGTLRSRLNSAMSAVIGRHNMSDFLALDEALVQQNHAAIEREIAETERSRIESEFGVELVSVGIRRVSLPDVVTSSVFQSMTQEREAVATRIREEGRATAASIVSRAQSLADTIKGFALFKAEEIKAAGGEASARVLAQIKPEDREFFIWLRWLDAMKASLKEKSTIFFDSDSELFRNFTRPLGADAGKPTPARPGSTEN